MRWPENEIWEANRVVCNFWQLLFEQEWDEAHTYLSENFEAYWPQTGEKLAGGSNFIQRKRETAADCLIQTLDAICEFHRMEWEYSVAAQVRINTRMPDGSLSKSYVLSFFVLDCDHLIKEMVEYQADRQPPRLSLG